MDPLAIHQAGQAASASALPSDLKGACRALEQEFARLIFASMRQALVPSSKQGSAGFARETTEAMLDGQWAELASQGEGLGLWRSLCRELEDGAVKSAPQQADQGYRIGAHRKEAGHEPTADSRAPGAGLGSARIGATPQTYASLPGLSRSKAILGARPLLGGGEGK